MAAAAGSPRLVVHVVGAVRRPGSSGCARAPGSPMRSPGQAVRPARPTCRAVNLAAPLADGQQVSCRCVSHPGRVRTGAVAPGGKVSLAVATVEQLDELPGHRAGDRAEDRRLAQAHGPFRSVEDLDEVPGIGPARIEQLRELVTP